MGWTKREVSSNLVIIGDAEGQVRKVGGLLASITPDPRYPDNKRYELVQQDGTVKTLAGSASINSTVGVGDIGKFMKCTFLGWEPGKNGRFKNIQVDVYEGDPTPDMKKWPRFAELHGKAKAQVAPNGGEPEPEPPVEEDDDLPF